MTEQTAALGRRLRRLRRHRKLTQHNVATLVGCSLTSISYYERGRFRPKRGILLRLASVLDCDYLWLLGNEDAPSPLPPPTAPADPCVHEIPQPHQQPNVPCSLERSHPGVCQPEAADV